MSTTGSVITAEQAQQMAAQFARAMNKTKPIPKLPVQLQKFSDENQVYIYNVGPWNHEVCLGSAGTFIIQRSEKGKDYGRPLVVPGLPVEPIFSDNPMAELRQEPGGGRYLAEQIVGIGAHRNRQQSLVKRGVFIAEGRTPTKEEITAAKNELDEHYKRKVQEARALYDQGPNFAKTIDPSHFEAARALNLTDEAWMVRSNPGARKKCDGCGTPHDIGPAVCPVCRYIIDEEKYAKMKGRFAA